MKNNQFISKYLWKPKLTFLEIEKLVVVNRITISSNLYS